MTSHVKLIPVIFALSRFVRYCLHIFFRRPSYNLKNQLVAYETADTTASYIYGANGLRKSKTVDGTETDFVWNNGNLVEELTGTTVKSKYNYGVDGITSVTSNNTSILYLKNAHGDIVGITDIKGNISTNYRYDAFGNVLSDSEPDCFGYCGEFLDRESGLVYLRNRYYDTATGRFITEDPVKDGHNWYSYCDGNPVMFIDPSGLISVIFVSSNMSDQADVRATFYTEKYGTDTYKIEVDSAESFVNKWNDFFYEHSSDSIDAIEIISHGSIDGDVGKDSSGTAYSTGYIYFTDSQKNKLYAREIKGMKSGDRSVENLTYVSAKELNIESCNSANKDTYNIVYGFMQRTNITGTITGFDGGAQWSQQDGDHIRGGGDFTNDLPLWAFGDPWYYVKAHQYTWWKYVSKNHNGNPVREREGRRYF